MTESPRALSLQRAPWLVAALESLQAWVILGVISLTLGLTGWFWLQTGDVPITAALVNAVMVVSAGFGLPVELASGSFSLASPVLMIVPGLVMWRAARRTAEALTVNAARTRSAIRPILVALVTLAGLGSLVVIALALLSPAEGPAAVIAVVRAEVLLVLVTAVGLLAPLRRLGDAPTPRRSVDRALGAWLGEARWSAIGQGSRAALWTGLGIVVVAAILVVVSLIAHRDAVAEVAAAYGESGGAGIGLIVVQALFFTAPLAWAAAWSVGVGFSVGADSLYHFHAVVAQPVPALPGLGALPLSPHGWGWLLPIALCAVGAVIGLVRFRTSPEPWTALVTAFIVLLVTGAVVGLLGAGSLGTGRMEQIGSQPLLVALGFGLWFALGAAGALLFARHRPDQAAGEWLRRATDRTGGED